MPIAAFAVLAVLLAVCSGSAQAHGLSALVAPTSVCADQTGSSAPPAEQVDAMRCMTNFARRRDGLRTLGDSSRLDAAAARKSADILRCDSFSHSACGQAFTFWMRRSGYLAARCWRAGENIAWGTGDRGDVRSIFVAWLHSAEHRANLLGRYSQIGIAFRVGTLEGHPDAAVWTQDFGSRCGAPARHALPVGPQFALGIASRIF